MLLEQGHEKAGGFFAPFTGSFKNHGAGNTNGLQGQGKSNFANTIATQLGGLGNNNGTGIAQNPLLNAPNLTYPVALEGERLKGLNNRHIGMGAQPLANNGLVGNNGLANTGTANHKLSRKEKKALKNAQKNGGFVNPEYNNAAVY